MDNTKKGIYAILLLLFLFNILIYLNIFLARQIYGFLFLTLLPGFLLMKIFRINLGPLKTFLLSWGLSISFLTIFGLIFNTLALNLGYTKPLSTIVLVAVINFLLLLMLIIIWKYSIEIIPHSISLPRIYPAEKFFLILPVIYPALSVYGIYLMNTFNKNHFILLLLVLIAVHSIGICIFHEKISDKVYVTTILLNGLSLLLLLSLRSDYIYGADVHYEYYHFIQAINLNHWSIFAGDLLDPCITISLLPAIYKYLLNIDSQLFFKLYPTLLCFVYPLLIYAFYRDSISSPYPYLISLYFLSNANLLATAYNARAVIAMLFVSYALFILFDNEIELYKKRALFIVFLTTCLFSHYSTTYLFFFILLSTIIMIKLLNWNNLFKIGLTWISVGVFFILIFLWYGQISSVPFDNGINFIFQSISSLNYLFEAESKSSSSAQLLMGSGILAANIITQLHFILTWITFSFIGIGFLSFLTTFIEQNRSGSSRLSMWNKQFLNNKIYLAYLVMAFISLLTLILMLIVPKLSTGYGLGRSFQVQNTFLSVFFVTGGIILCRTIAGNIQSVNHVDKKQNNNYLLRSILNCLSNSPFPEITTRQEGSAKLSAPRAHLLILLVLIPYFLCVSGAFYAMYGTQFGITLCSEGYLYDYLYIHDQESSGMQWMTRLLERVDTSSTKVYASDFPIQYKMASQIGLLGVELFKEKKSSGYIFCGYGCIKNHDLNDSKLIDQSNEIYNSGGSNIWI
jgi:uncharacterized membrane protein